MLKKKLGILSFIILVFTMLTILWVTAASALTVPYYSQKDTSWSNDKLGSCSYTIATDGCAITSIAMVFKYYGVDINPRSMNNWLKTNAGYSNGCYVRWDVAVGASNGIVKYITKKTYDSVAIKNEIDNGHPVIAEITLNSGVQHFVVITSYSNNTFYINDPLYNVSSTINDRYGDPATKVKNIILYHPTTIPTQTGSASGILHLDSATGPALAGATVSCGGKSTTTASNGYFSLSGIPAGTQTISFSKTGYESYERPIQVTAGQNTDVGDRWLTSDPTPPSTSVPDLNVSYVKGLFSGESNWRKDLVMYEHETKTIQIKVKVSNDGEAEADKDDFKIKYYFSTNRSFDHNSDVKIGSKTVDYDLEEEGKDEDSDTETLDISSSDSLISAIKTPGTYYFFAWIDSDLLEEHKSNNTSDEDSSNDEYVKITVLPTPPAPAANFSASPVTGKAPLAVSFTDQSTSGPTAWSWNFGDGATSITKNPTHTYSSTGTFTVSLTVANAYGSNTSTKAGYITVTDDTACGGYPVQVAVSSYATVQAAYNSAATGSTIKIQDQLLSEDILLNRDITTTLKGGYNCPYDSQSGNTTIDGSLTIKNGSVTVENLIIK